MWRDGLVHELAPAVLAMALSAVLVTGLSPVPVVGLGSAPKSGGIRSSPAGDGIYAVTQAGSCYEVTTLGDGSQTVSQFYDYRPNLSFSSGGTRRVQENQATTMFVYDGANGDSLVIVHDAYDRPGGGAVSMTVTGLPASGSWAVEDDHYRGRDDNFVHSSSRSEIDWVWEDDRTDGAAFRGVDAAGQSGITIDPAFNERAALWGTWENRSDGGRIESWRLLSGSGWPVADLALDKPVTIRPGGCDRTPPTATLAAERATVQTNQQVRLSAADATDDTGIVEYRWDLDGDGTVERKTTSPTVTTAYETAREFQPRVTVVDAAGNADSASTSISVRGDSPSHTIQRAAAGALRTTLANAPGTCGYSSEQSLGECVAAASG